MTDTLVNVGRELLVAGMRGSVQVDLGTCRHHELWGGRMLGAPAAAVLLFSTDL